MAYTPGKRRFQIVSGDWDEDLLNLEEASITEGLSCMFGLQLSLFSEKDSIPFGDIIGKHRLNRINIA